MKLKRRMPGMERAQPMMNYWIKANSQRVDLISQDIYVEGAWSLTIGLAPRIGTRRPERVLKIRALMPSGTKRTEVWMALAP